MRKLNENEIAALKGQGCTAEDWQDITVEDDFCTDHIHQVDFYGEVTLGSFNKVVEVAAQIKPSARGELEITTVNQEFLSAGELKVQTLGRGFAWLDTGTHDSLTEATNYIETIEKRQGLKVACLEGIALRKGWVTPERVREMAAPMRKNQYGQYLLRMADEFEKRGADSIDIF